MENFYILKHLIRNIQKNNLFKQGSSSQAICYSECMKWSWASYAHVNAKLFT